LEYIIFVWGEKYMEMFIENCTCVLVGSFTLLFVVCVAFAIFLVIKWMIDKRKE
jgi:hypothetical protein